MPHLERYWRDAAPSYCDGEGAESFNTLLRRCEAALARLAALPAGSLAYVCGHGQFVQAARAIVTETELDARGKMLRFWRKGARPRSATRSGSGSSGTEVCGIITRLRAPCSLRESTRPIIRKFLILILNDAPNFSREEAS